MKKIKYYGLLLITILNTSCNSLKIKELQTDYIQELKGKIKKIEVKSEFYGLPTNTSKIVKENNIFFYDNLNRISKQFDNFNGEIEYNYVNGNLDNTIRKSKIGISKTQYKYDKKKNLIEVSEYQNDTLYFVKKSVFNSKNLLQESTYTHPNSIHLNSYEKFSYDLMNNFTVIQFYDHNNNLKEEYLKLTFDKKGNIIISETLHKDYKITTKLNYDKSGNLESNHTTNIKGKQDDYITYNNIFDEKGNIILREKFLGDKLIMKTFYEITYW